MNLESATSGQPVIIAMHSEYQKTVDDDIMGYLVKSVFSLVAAIQRFIILPHKDKKKRGVMARKKTTPFFQ